MDDDKKKIKVISLIIALVIIILSVIIVIVILSNKTDYKKLEKEMVRVAKEKVETQNIEVKIQDFMNLEALNITDGAEVCSKASGVIITNVNGRLEYKAYLKCVDYESTILKNSEKYIKLKGSAVVLANKNAMYFDEGYEQIDNNITVEKVGTVINEPGAYTINYVIKKNDKQKTVVKRIVIVSDIDINITQSGIINKDEPTITLKGEKEMYLTINGEYVEPGYSAYDYKDGKINHDVKVFGNVDTTKVGANKITYTVKNSQGKMYSIDRIVHVVKEVADLDILISQDDKGSTTNKSIITITVMGNKFRKIILPNGAENPFSTASYEVTENGVYTFEVVDIYNNKINKSIIVNNIDNIAPTGTCAVKNNNGVYEFNVVGEDESGISAVNYIIDDKESGFLATTVYQTREKVSKASVILQDVAGNQTKISCSVEDVDSQEESTYSFKYTRKEDIGNKPYISCNSYTAGERTTLEANLENEITIAGYGTRAGVVAAEETDPLYYDKKVEFGLWIITWKVNIKDLKPEDVWIIDGHNRIKANLVSYVMDPDTKQAITSGSSSMFIQNDYQEILLVKVKDVLALTSSKYKIKEINVYDIENNKKICSDIDFEDYSFEIPNLKGKYVFELVTSNAKGIYNYSFAMEIQ